MEAGAVQKYGEHKPNSFMKGERTSINNLEIRNRLRNTQSQLILIPPTLT
jgi:hypothetical protein